MWNPLKALMGMFTPYVEPEKPDMDKESEAYREGNKGIEVEPPVPTNKVCLNPGESRTFTRVAKDEAEKLDLYNKKGVRDPRKPLSDAEIYHNQRIEDKKKDDADFNRRRKHKQKARRSQGPRNQSNHTSYGHDDSPPCNSPSPSPSPSSDSVCGGGE